MSANESDSGSEIEIITPSKPQSRPSPKPKQKINPPRQSSRLDTPHLSVTPAASPNSANEENETPRITPRATLTSTRAATRPPSSNSSSKGTSSSRASKKSTPASRSSSKLNAAPSDKRVSSSRQSKRRKTSRASIDQSEEKSTLDSTSTVSKTASEESTLCLQSPEIPSLTISPLETHPLPKSKNLLNRSLTQSYQLYQLTSLSQTARKAHKPHLRSSHEPESIPTPSLERLSNDPISATSIESTPIPVTSNESVPASGSTIAPTASDLITNATLNPKPTEDPIAIEKTQATSKIVADAPQARNLSAHIPEAGGVKPPPRRRAPRAIRAQKPPNQDDDDDDDDDFCNLSSRNPVQFVSKTLGLTAGDRRSASVVAPSSCAPEHQSPERPTNVIYLSDEDSDKAGSSSQPGSDIEVSQASTGRTRRRKRKSSSVKLPKWTMEKVIDSSSDEELSKKTTGKNRAMSVSSDDSDNSDKPEPSKTIQAKAVKEKRARRAPTPPPRIDQYLINQNLNLHALRCQLAMGSRSSTADDSSEAFATSDDLDESTLDPALAQVRRQIMTSNEGNFQANRSHETGTQVQWSGHEIELSVSMVFDPRKIATSDPMEIKVYEEREPFSKVYDVLYATNPHFPPDSIILARDNIKLSPWVTPQSVDIMTDTTLKAYEPDVWQFIKTNPVQSNTRDNHQAINYQPETGNQSSQDEAPSAINASEKTDNKRDEENRGVGDNHIKITVRNGNKNGLEMIVKPTTSAKKCKLEFDGEHLELTTKIQETEIEDGEVLDLIFT
ncbi:hypothetical protein DFH28DRAFT_980656 [Melampsora americana]|nr:hypothetical protein DFH28DRAFT_980656 [Melampsora americana]